MISIFEVGFYFIWIELGSELVFGLFYNKYVKDKMIGKIGVDLVFSFYVD